MNEIVYKVLKKKDFIVKNYLIKVAHELELTLNDFLLLVYFFNQEEPTLNIDNIKYSIFLTEDEIMESFQKLNELGLITTNIVKDDKGNRREVISLDNLVKVATSDITTTSKNNSKSNIFAEFEKEFGRTLSPIEYEMINNWISSGFSEETIKSALKEAILNGARSMRYIDKILISWKENGYKKTKNTNSDNVDDNTSINLFEYDWLDDNEE